jgi:hypothetical protein
MSDSILKMTATCQHQFLRPNVSSSQGMAEVDGAAVRDEAASLDELN